MRVALIYFLNLKCNISKTTNKLIFYRNFFCQRMVYLDLNDISGTKPDIPDVFLTHRIRLIVQAFLLTPLPSFRLAHSLSSCFCVSWSSLVSSLSLEQARMSQIVDQGILLYSDVVKSHVLTSGQKNVEEKKQFGSQDVRWV